MAGVSGDYIYKNSKRVQNVINLLENKICKNYQENKGRMSFNQQSRVVIQWSEIENLTKT